MELSKSPGVVCTLSTKYRPSAVTATTVLLSLSGLSAVLVASGNVNVTPACNRGAMSMTMIRSTSITSASGVMLISELRAVALVANLHPHGLFSSSEFVTPDASASRTDASGRNLPAKVYDFLMK